MLWIIVIILVLGGVSLSITTFGIEKYYLMTQKIELNRVYEEIKELPIQIIYERSYALGREYNILLITIPWQEDLDKLNEELKNAFIEQGVLVQKLWLGEEDASKLAEGQIINQLYNQGSIGYSLFVKYYIENDQLIIMGRTISHIDHVLNIIHFFIIMVWLTALLIISLCIVLYVRYITKPLLEMESLVGDISHLKFRQIQVDTGDELESLSRGINTMSERLQTSHSQLQKKNEQMKEFLANVSHELKTPIALIKAYGIAIEDGMDDGTFLATILEQNKVMEEMVNKLLILAKKEQQASIYTTINLKKLIQGYLKDYEIYRNQVDIVLRLEEVSTVWGDEEAIRCGIGNFISNAIKYTADGRVEVRCYQKENMVHIEVRNGITEKGRTEIEHLWEPFYVVENSRNKEICGTGLGLYMTRKLLNEAGIIHGCFLQGDTIAFYMKCKKKQ